MLESIQESSSFFGGLVGRENSSQELMEWHGKMEGKEGTGGQLSVCGWCLSSQPSSGF